MSRAILEGHVSGTGSVTLKSPNTNTDYVLDLPAVTGTVLTLAGGNLTGGINSARGNITQHATTMDFFAVTSPDILDGTGSAVTITACVNAPQAGATRKFYPIVATVLTHGATFDIAGNANLTAAAGDCWIIEAKTVSTYRVTTVKENGSLPLGVAFLATGTGQTAVTGAGVTVTVAYGTEVFDRGANFASNTFTAPVTGIYQLNVQVTTSDQSAGTNNDAEITLVTSNRNHGYAYNPGNMEAASVIGDCSAGFSILTDMDAGDTAYVQVVVHGGTQIVNIIGARSKFSGWLVG